MNAILVNRALLMGQLNVNEDEFQNLLELANIEDADNFTEDDARAVKSAYVSQNTSNRNRPPLVPRSLPTSSTSAPVGESQSTGTSQIAGGFQELLDGQYLALEAQVNSALASHRGKVENLLGEALEEALDIPFQIMEDLQDSPTIAGTNALSLPQSQG
jgi:hypothetical protein